MKLRLLLPADQEFADAALYYSEESPSAARKFKEAVEDALRQIAQNPTRYRRYTPRVRMKVVRNFPYSIFYSIDPDEVIVVAIAHDAREPRYWGDRL